MKIIKHGNKYMGTKYECFCCGCKFEIEQKEMKMEKSEEHIPFHSSYPIYRAYAKCPECGEKIYTD